MIDLTTMPDDALALALLVAEHDLAKVADTGGYDELRHLCKHWLRLSREVKRRKDASALRNASA